MKTLNFRILFTGLLLLTVLGACTLNCKKGSGNEKQEDRKVADFSKIDVSGDYDITIKQDSSLSVSITADDNLLPYIRSEVDGGQLRIYSKKGLCTQKAIIVKIGVRNLDEIKGSGGISVSSDGKLNVKDINMHFSGASKVNMELVANNVTTKGSGATEISLKGQAASHTLELTGSGKVSALDFVVNKYTIHTTGASECQINVLNELDVRSTGASDVEYRGNPSTINNNKTGASTIKKID